ncbi:serine hydrolase domain-containing protein [Aquimarina sp. 2-A2]|uniref:serine hydrolase domain-containing protein n=1 Tax=Aquimarina sp. 2-A2 TaxID=3382644 RepID=UPI00387F261A
MKRRQIIFLTIVSALIGLIALGFINYQKLTILSGYSAKNTCSSVFLANRSLEFTDAHDNNFAPVNLAYDQIDTTQKSAEASVFGLMKRTALYREGLGSVLVDDSYAKTPFNLRPNRAKISKVLPYPYGNLPQKDTVFRNVDYKKIARLVNHIIKQDSLTTTRAILVLYKDQIIAEHYAEGYRTTSKFLGWSMTKSILATLIGIRQFEGNLDIMDTAPVEQWNQDDRKNITIHNLLQMNSGLAWDEDYGSISDVTRMLFIARDMTTIQADKKLLHAPGSYWNYSSGTTNLLSGILRKQFRTTQEYLDYPYKVLIDRIGMHSMVLEADMEGNYVGSSYAWATARDWAKFGLLYLHEGNWNGDQIFDTDWVAYVTTSANDSNGVYGGHFWLHDPEILPDVPSDIYSANGYQGQRIFIIPSKELVIARFGLSGDFDFNNFIVDIVGAIH